MPMENSKDTLLARLGRTEDWSVAGRDFRQIFSEFYPLVLRYLVHQGFDEEDSRKERLPKGSRRLETRLDLAEGLLWLRRSELQVPDDVLMRHAAGETHAPGGGLRLCPLRGTMRARTFSR
jgi:hypothetical protein